MDRWLCRSSLSFALLGACTAEPSDELCFEDTGDLRTGATVDPTPPAARCDGTPLPDCDGSFTGATCDLPCSPTHDSGTGSCGVDLVCHSDGRPYALSTRNAVLYPASPDAPDDAIEADLESWIAQHPAELGLSAGLSVDDVELHRLPHFRSSAGPLTLFRFVQTYHGLPVLAPDGIDGTDWRYASCDDMPQYSGGTLTCDQDTCMLDETQCSMPGLDTTAGTMTPGETAESTAGTGPETETDPGAAGGGSDGCDCRAGASKSVWLALFAIPVFGAGRRRRSV